MDGPGPLDVQELARSNERLREQQGAIGSVLRTVVRSAELQPVLDEVSDAARRLCAGQYASLYLADGDALRAVSGAGGLEAWEYDKSHPHALDRTTFAGRLASAVERQRTELARFVSPQVAALLSSERGEQLLAGHRAYVSCLFCDLRGSTAFSETAAPEEQLELLRDYHGLIGELIARHDGTLEHFAGDGLMVFFNDPVPVEDHELAAIRMALSLHARFRELAETWRKRGFDIGLGIGVAAGYATLGRIGFEARYDYGVVGPVTNLASRLSTHAADGQTLISQRVVAEVESAVDASPVGEIELKGFARPVVAYEVRGVR